MTAPPRTISVLDHGFVSYVDHMGDDSAFVEAARMSTQKGFLGWGTDEAPGDERLLSYLYRNDHATPFEFGQLVIEAQAPIFVVRQWHRHRVPFSYNEASGRYGPLPDLDYLPSVERLMQAGGANKQASAAKGAPALTREAAERHRARLARAYVDSETLYQEALAAGVPMELARVHLPLARYTRHRVSANVRGWLAFLALRQDEHAQWEIRQYADAVAAIVADLWPRTFALYEEHTRHAVKLSRGERKTLASYRAATRSPMVASVSLPAALDRKIAGDL
jgi:thymidylate synthase (FAD)